MNVTVKTKFCTHRLHASFARIVCTHCLHALRGTNSGGRRHLYGMRTASGGIAPGQRFRNRNLFKKSSVPQNFHAVRTFFQSHS